MFIEPEEFPEETSDVSVHRTSIDGLKKALKGQKQGERNNLLTIDNLVQSREKGRCPSYATELEEDAKSDVTVSHSDVRVTEPRANSQKCYDPPTKVLKIAESYDALYKMFLSGEAVPEILRKNVTPGSAMTSTYDDRNVQVHNVESLLNMLKTRRSLQRLFTGR